MVFHSFNALSASQVHPLNLMTVHSLFSHHQTAYVLDGFFSTILLVRFSNLYIRVSTKS